jgi:streptogramin lyase
MGRCRALAPFALSLMACGGSAHFQPPREDAGAPDSGLADRELSGCADEDGDGAGVGRDCPAHDCDDTDPLTIDQCGTGCDDRPERLGCPCSFNEPALCFHGPEGAGGRGACRPGLQECLDGARGPCEGQVLPRAEQCDELDDDCDGETDEGVTNECGRCGDCSEGACFGAGSDCSRWSEGHLDHAVEVGEGSLTLARVADEARVVWPTHRGNCIAYKVEPATRSILGAYLTSDQEVDMHETTVDRDGNVVLVHLGGSWVTRIARDEADCPDRNANGVVDTSHAADEMLAFAAPDEWEDECILWHSQVAEMAKTVALHESYGLDGLLERAWVGIDDDEGADLDSGFVELDLDTGEPTGRTLSSPGFGPTGSATDDRGRIWTVAATSVLGVFDPAALDRGIELHERDGSLAYVTVDENGFPWVRGEGGVFRFDPATEVFEPVYEQWELEQGLAPWGGLLAPDGEGGILQADWLVYRIDIATLEWEVLDFGGKFSHVPRAIGVDFLRQAWVLVSFVPGASVYDLATQEVTAALDDCGQDVCENSAAHGDFTGLPWALVQPERGVWTEDLVACEGAGDVVWTRLRASATIPPGTSVSLWVRTGVDDVDLWEGEWLRAGPLADGETELDLAPVLGEPTRRHHALALQARLEAGRGAASPILTGVELSWGCQRVE